MAGSACRLPRAVSSSWSIIYTEATGCAEFVGWLINKQVLFSEHHKVVLYKRSGFSFLPVEVSLLPVVFGSACHLLWALAFTRGQGEWSMSVQLAQERTPTSTSHLYFWVHEETKKQVRNASNVF